MVYPKVAIVGRPNVGKSSLLNWLTRQRISIVDPTPGVTRDRVSAVIEVDSPLEAPSGSKPKDIELIDTGGWGVYSADGKRFTDAGEDLSQLTELIEHQIRMAIEDAALILFVVDGQTGPTSLDKTVASLLRKWGCVDRVAIVANKTDGDSWVPSALEAAAMGMGEPACVSAMNGFGMGTLLDLMWTRIDGVPPSEDEDEEGPLKVAIVGKRNAGKSTLVNALAGTDRVIVSEIAGTTRDAIDVKIEFDGRDFIAIDTAGLRRKKSLADSIEYYAYHRMLQAIRRADVVLLLIDATKPISTVDQKLAQELQRQLKPTVMVMNKWDQVDEKTVTPDQFLEYLTSQLRGLDFAPIIFVSALEGDGLGDLLSLACNLHEQASHRESTAKINTVVGAIMDKRGPSSRLGTQAKLYFASQIGTNPPTLAMVVNRPKLFRGRYERYLMNRLREELPFSEVPIRLMFSKRTRKTLHALLSGETDLEQ